MSPQFLIDIEKEVIEPENLIFEKGVGKTIKSGGRIYANRRKLGAVYFKLEIFCEENNLPVIKRVKVIFMPKTQNYRLEQLLIIDEDLDTGDTFTDLLTSIPPRSKHRCHDITDEAMFKKSKLEKIRFAACDRLNGATDFPVKQNGLGTFWQEPNLGQFYIKY